MTMIQGGRKVHLLRKLLDSGLVVLPINSVGLKVHVFGSSWESSRAIEDLRKKKNFADLPVCSWSIIYWWRVHFDSDIWASYSSGTIAAARTSCKFWSDTWTCQWLLPFCLRTRMWTDFPSVSVIVLSIWMTFCWSAQEVTEASLYDVIRYAPSVVAQGVRIVDEEVEIVSAALKSWKEIQKWRRQSEHWSKHFLTLHTCTFPYPRASRTTRHTTPKIILFSHRFRPPISKIWFRTTKRNIFRRPRKYLTSSVTVCRHPTSVRRRQSYVLVVTSSDSTASVISTPKIRLTVMTLPSFLELLVDRLDFLQITSQLHRSSCFPLPLNRLLPPRPLPVWHSWPIAGDAALSLTYFSLLTFYSHFCERSWKWQQMHCQCISLPRCEHDVVQG